jgi:hypothetical protein
MKYSFDVGPEGWCSYDYNGCIRAGRNIFVLAVWQSSEERSYLSFESID